MLPECAHRVGTLSPLTRDLTPSSVVRNSRVLSLRVVMSVQVMANAVGTVRSKRVGTIAITAAVAGCATLAMLLGCTREPSAASPLSAPPQQRWDLRQWTPEMHAAARALVDQEYSDGRAAIEAIMKGSHRSPGAADRDRYRQPAETLAFFGFAPTMTVLDVGPGAGYYTELLAPALAKHGHYVATNLEPPRSAPALSVHHWSEYEGVRFDELLRASPEIYGKVEVVRVDYKAPRLNLDATVDLALVMREVHMMKNWGTLDTWLREVHRALKPNGVLGVEDHRASPGADPDASVQKGYLPEAWVVAKIEAAGFVLAGRSELYANARDTEDYPNGVWSLPPSFQVGADYARASVPDPKYVAIGESDRMLLKFVKAATATAR